MHGSPAPVPLRRPVAVVGAGQSAAGRIRIHAIGIPHPFFMASPTRKPDRQSLSEACRLIAAIEFDRAFVPIWLHCRTLPDFVDRLRAARNDMGAHRRTVDTVVELLRDDPVSASDLLLLHATATPVAVLAALDTVLHERSGRYFTPRRVECAGEAYWLAMRSRFANRNPRHMRAHESLDFFAPHFSVVPCCLGTGQMQQPPRVDYAGQDRLGAHGARRVEQIVANRVLRVVVAAFADGIGFDPEPAGRWRAAALKDVDARWRGILNILEKVSGDADVVVFPELTVTPELRDRIARWLMAEDRTLCWVVAGSFHVPEAAQWRNRSWLLDRQGNLLLDWDKFLPVQLGEGDSEIVEAIDRPDEMRLLDTPLGLVAIPVCRDFCEEVDGVRIPWGTIPVDFLFVPSMGTDNTMSAHRRAADTLWRHGTVCVVANQDIASRGDQPGFVAGNVDGAGADGVPNVNCVSSVRLDIDAPSE